jgi:AcrR family transcriptional regulator/DNA-binding MarR family transcriptional regulator
MEGAQRTRVLECLAELMLEQGAGPSAVTLADLGARSGVSTAALHEHFADRDALLLAAFELGVERARGAMEDAFAAEDRWLDAIKAALAAFLRFLEREPALARVTVVHAMAGGVELLRRRAEVLQALAAIVARGRVEATAGRQAPPEVIAEGVVGAVVTVVHNRLVTGEQGTAAELFGSLVSIIALPYMGPSVARRELIRPLPRPRPVPGSGADGALAGHAVETRLTYRTARVLRAIGDYPGASNREVAERAGVIDQGQISKLLGRLQVRELIEKIGGTRARGAPNSWRLTERGELARAGAEERVLPGEQSAKDTGAGVRVRLERRAGLDRRR